MIYLRTGANGAGKTLLTLRDVREKSLAEARPVYYNGRFNMTADFGWHKIDAKDWETVPDGAIFLFDECHNDFPIRSGKDVPRYVSQLAEHRVRGFDFFLITQHPMNIDAFVRRLIGSPGWHQHLKRASGAPLVSVIEWPAVNDAPQKNGSGATGATKMVPYPKEVYNWYVSTSLDTAKIKIPFQVKLLVVSVFLIPTMSYFGWKSMQKAQPLSQLQTPAAGTGGPMMPVSTEKHVLTALEFAQSFVPRIDGIPYSSPRYDELTKPVNVPYPAACVQSKTRCQCYTQQATKLFVPESLCGQIVAGGFFNDWQAAVNAAMGIRTAQPAPVVVAAADQNQMTLPPASKPVSLPETSGQRVIQIRAPFPVFAASAPAR